MFYSLTYAMGYKPWEDLERNSGFAGKLLELLDSEESGRLPPYGQALDLGCGSGIWGVELAKRGWRVTGVDMVGKALRCAGERAKNANVGMRLVRGNATALRQAGVGGGFRLILDTGAYHALSSAQRRDMGREVNAVAACDASILLLVWPQSKSSSVERTIRSQTQASFPRWTVSHIEPSRLRLSKFLELLLPPGEHCYWCRLRRAEL